METINSDALFRIKNSLIIDKISREENIRVDQESLTAKLDSLSAMYQMDKETFAKYMFQNPNMINNLSQQVLNEKVIAFLVENNSANFIKAKAKKTEKTEKAVKKTTKATKTTKTKAKKVAK